MDSDFYDLFLANKNLSATKIIELAKEHEITPLSESTIKRYKTSLRLEAEKLEAYNKATRLNDAKEIEKCKAEYLSQRDRNAYLHNHSGKRSGRTYKISREKLEKYFIKLLSEPVYGILCRQKIRDYILADFKVEYDITKVVRVLTKMGVPLPSGTLPKNHGKTKGNFKVKAKKGTAKDIELFEPIFTAKNFTYDKTEYVFVVLYCVFPQEPKSNIRRFYKLFPYKGDVDSCVGEFVKMLEIRNEPEDGINDPLCSKLRSDSEFKTFIKSIETVARRR